jgi:hypothetical protein
MRAPHARPYNDMGQQRSTCFLNIVSTHIYCHICISLGCMSIHVTIGVHNKVPYT